MMPLPPVKVSQSASCAISAHRLGLNFCPVAKKHVRPIDKQPSASPISRSKPVQSMKKSPCNLLPSSKCKQEISPLSPSNSTLSILPSTRLTPWFLLTNWRYFGVGKAYAKDGEYDTAATVLHDCQRFFGQASLSGSKPEMLKAQRPVI